MMIYSYRGANRYWILIFVSEEENKGPLKGENTTISFPSTPLSFHVNPSVAKAAEQSNL